MVSARHSNQAKTYIPSLMDRGAVDHYPNKQLKKPRNLSLPQQMNQNLRQISVWYKNRAQELCIYCKSQQPSQEDSSHLPK